MVKHLLSRSINAIISFHVIRVLYVFFSVASSSRNPGITARALANVSDMLGAMAHGEGGLRSGPALNKQWSHAFKHLEVNHLVCCFEILLFLVTDPFDAGRTHY